jgi:uncharacterized SAM-binding protein YcdF (DUF218 family)
MLKSGRFAQQPPTGCIGLDDRYREAISMPSPARSWFRALGWLLAIAVVAVFCVLHWGATFLIAENPPPGRVDAAVVLQGSISAEKVRIAQAMDLLRRAAVDRVLLSVPKESYWGQSIPPVARVYLERTYGADVAARVEFCETSGEVNSTAQEAKVLSACIHDHAWHSIVVVTSSYHTRRAGMVWRRSGTNSGVRVFVEGVADPEFQQPWWRHRQSAKVWFMESSKLAWAALGG